MDVYHIRLIAVDGFHARMPADRPERLGVACRRIEHIAELVVACRRRIAVCKVVVRALDADGVVVVHVVDLLDGEGEAVVDVRDLVKDGRAVDQGVPGLFHCDNGAVCRCAGAIGRCERAGAGGVNAGDGGVVLSLANASLTSAVLNENVVSLAVDRLSPRRGQNLIVIDVDHISALSAGEDIIARPVKIGVVGGRVRLGHEHVAAACRLGDGDRLGRGGDDRSVGVLEGDGDRRAALRHAGEHAGIVYAHGRRSIGLPLGRVTADVLFRCRGQRRRQRRGLADADGVCAADRRGIAVGAGGEHGVKVHVGRAHCAEVGQRGGRRGGLRPARKGIVGLALVALDRAAARRSDGLPLLHGRGQEGAAVGVVPRDGVAVRHNGVRGVAGVGGSGLLCVVEKGLSINIRACACIAAPIAVVIDPDEARRRLVF